MIKETLQNELKALEPKLQKTRENNDFGTYKNLMLAYKEVLTLLLDVTDKDFTYESNNIVGNREGGHLLLQKNKNIIDLDCINYYSYQNNSLYIEMPLIDKNLLLDLKKNQFKGYILTHILPMRNVNQVDSILTKKYKVLSSDYCIKQLLDKPAKYIFTFKLKDIK